MGACPQIASPVRGDTTLSHISKHIKNILEVLKVFPIQ
jgi:hypothetical protein